VFTRVGSVNHFYSATVPFVDLEHDLLETQLGEEINSDNDPVTGDGDVQTLLVDHYQSLMRAASRHTGDNHEYRIGNAWTMKASNVMSPPDEEAGRADEGDDCLGRDNWYFEQGRFERMRQSFDEKRGRRIESYMLLVIAETRDSFESENTWVRKLDGMLVDETEAKGKGATATGEDRVKMESDRRTADGVMELSLLEEWERMEMLLVYEADK
jgi:hypothetical protein